MKSNKVQSALVGAAGEHLVLSRLLARGVLAAQAPRGAFKVDILVNFLDDREPVMLQVKSRTTGSDGGWHMQEKHELQRDENIFYCFVDFQIEQPLVYVIPSAVVAEAIETDHRIWLETPGKYGQPHGQTKFRRLRPLMNGKEPGWMDEFLEAWDYFL